LIRSDGAAGAEISGFRFLSGRLLRMASVGPFREFW